MEYGGLWYRRLFRKEKLVGYTGGDRRYAPDPAGIEFYSWDFTYDSEKGFKPSIIIDKEGKQVVSLKTGTHTIVVKVVDNDGLENMEVIKLKINGVVEQVK